MKRSEINQIIAEAARFFEELHFHLPPFARWSPEDWKTKREKAAEIAEVRLGWDITDFGFDDFANRGLVLFTVRNGKLEDPAYPKCYAEKAMVVQPGQLTLTHCHWKKTEDIINRGGGRLILELHNATEDDQLDDSPVVFSMDGVRYEMPAGSRVTLNPGESITLTPRLYHSFWGDPEAGPVFVGEVSSVNDDKTDNCFLEPQLRFPRIEEDQEPLRYLVSDYDQFLS